MEWSSLLLLIWIIGVWVYTINYFIKNKYYASPGFLGIVALFLAGYFKGIVWPYFLIKAFIKKRKGN